jgi:histidine triad (HIT) family protein
VFDFFLRLAGTDLGRKLAGWTLAYMNFAIPVKRLRETETLLAFYHPKPAYPFHVLLVPKGPISSLMDLDPRSDFLVDVVTIVKSLVAEFQLSAYRLIVNGGEYQDFPLLHFHLTSPLLPGEGQGEGG